MPDLFLSLQKLLRCEVGLFGYLVLRCVRTGLFRSVAYGKCVRGIDSTSKGYSLQYLVIGQMDLLCSHCNCCNYGGTLCGLYNGVVVVLILAGFPAGIVQMIAFWILLLLGSFGFVQAFKLMLASILLISGNGFPTVLTAFNDTEYAFSSTDSSIRIQAQCYKMEPKKIEGLEELVAAKMEMENKLKALEQQIYDFEETFLKETTNYSNVVKGELFGDSGSYSAPQPVSRKGDGKPRYKKADRIFSYSSVTSPNEVEELCNDENARKGSGMPSSSRSGSGFLRPRISVLRKRTFWTEIGKGFWREAGFDVLVFGGEGETVLEDGAVGFWLSGCFLRRGFLNGRFGQSHRGRSLANEEVASCSRLRPKVFEAPVLGRATGKQKGPTCEGEGTSADHC
ncbi:unnamed protein product [Enterobius vermicularis]|uniref:Chromatin modification-related protein MEAF6 n=1 Tax=Enterobius vermicularis TaxID=51028 RepID=A0A0N4V774_ENTVE|nr:unnamed protein product [Enterobius vermicularis]